ncbi:hypothetical protein FQN54_000548 [Arachnomyces sp. PD_36]|nr:hypothetical protein FQN54_000548 [Arachnomyces sp. PD_36]
MAGTASRAKAKPTYFSEDDSEDDGLDLDAYLKVGSIQNQQTAGNSRERKLGGATSKGGLGLLKNKTGTSRDALGPEKTSRRTIKNPSPAKSKATEPQTQGVSKGGRSPTKTRRDMDESSSSGALSTSKGKRSQRPLKAAEVNALLLPLSQLELGSKSSKASQNSKKNVLDRKQETPEPSTETHEEPDGVCTPKPECGKRNVPRTASKRTKKETNYVWPGDEQDDEEFDSLADFIVSDNEDVSLYESHEESEDDKEELEPIQEVQRPRGKLVRGRTPRAKKEKGPAGYKGSADDEEPLSRRPIDLALPPELHLKPTKLFSKKDKSPGKTYPPLDSDEQSGEAEEPDSPLKHLPSREDSPPMEGTGFVTPPSSPSKPRLKSPSKEKKQRIPDSPHRPSIDAFWSQDVINDWNDQYSPRKEQTPFRRRIMELLQEEDENSGGNPLNTTTPSKPTLSPTKARAEAAAAKKAAAQKKREFDSRKVQLAEDFLKELDDKVTGGQIQKLAESTGGVKIVWSKTLNSTAGRANWKRVVKAPRSSSPSDTTDRRTTTHHHAKIELAEKVIDSPDRLINTLAHEYCHLTNFMISNIRTHPHGTSFKSWASKVTSAFATHPLYGGGMIRVTTKHSYEIQYKYVWLCEGCGKEYGRHSKSIDPSKARCGREGCRGCLRQIRPVPRRSPVKKGAGAGGSVGFGKGKKKGDERASPVEVVDVDGEESSGVETVTKDLGDVELLS